MAVLAEAISVIVRRDSIERRLPGGWSAFVRSVPNATLCDDGIIARVGFMDPRDVGRYIDWLERKGLVFVRDGKTIDLAVVDQFTGPTAPCEWLEFGRFPFGVARAPARGLYVDSRTADGVETEHTQQADEDDGEIALCWFFDEPRSMGPGLYVRGEISEMEIFCPGGWTFEDSLSQNSGFVPIEEASRLRFVRHDDDSHLDVYVDPATGRETYMARASEPVD